MCNKNFVILLLSLLFLSMTSCISFSHKKNFFDWPVDRARLTQKFKRHKHLGIDLAAEAGTPILAAHDGIVVYTGNDYSGFGLLIIIESKTNEWGSFYGHLRKISVEEGDIVSQGTPIGEMGNTGRSSGVHLHFEIRKNKIPQDPLSFLPP